MWGGAQSGLPSLIDELDEGQSSVLLNGVLPLLRVEDTSALITKLERFGISVGILGGQRGNIQKTKW